MCQLHWHSSLKQAEEPYSAKQKHKRKKFLLAQSHAEEKGQDRIFREAQSALHPNPIKNCVTSSSLKILAVITQTTQQLIHLDVMTLPYKNKNLNMAPKPILRH